MIVCTMALLTMSLIYADGPPRARVEAELQRQGYAPVEVRHAWVKGHSCPRHSGARYDWRAARADGYTCGTPGYDSFRVLVLRTW